MRLYITHFIFATVIGLACISCSDSDDQETTQPQTPVEDADSVRYSQTVAQMFDYDSTRINYQPKYGEVLEAVTPTIYSLGFKNENEARRWFLEHCVPTEEIDSIDSLKQDNMTLNFGKYGDVKYEKSNKPSAYATIYINLPEITAQTQINLIPLDLWPKNEASPFYVEDIVQRKDNKQYYICVRACEGGLKGLLISFSSYWNQDQYNKVNYKCSFGDFSVPKGASMDAWNAYAQLYDNDRERFKKYMLAFANKFPQSDMINNSAISFLIHDKDADTEHRYPTEPRGVRRRLIFSNWWYVTEDLVYVGKNTLIMKDGLPRFKTENVTLAQLIYFLLGYSVVAPKCSLDSHSEEFTADKSATDTYVKVFDAADLQ